MNNKLWMVGLFLLVIIGGCQATPESAARMVDSQAGQATKIVYLQDTGTGLCLASYLLGFREGALTNVPCNEQVLARAAKFESVLPARK